MIVTRQRKKKQNSLPILLPIAAIAMLIVALTWPPSRNFITNGPLHPVAASVNTFWSTVSRPLTFAYQQQQITDRNVVVKALNDKLETDRKAAGDKDAQIATLQKQVAAIQNQPEASTPAPVATIPISAGASSAVTGTSGVPAPLPAGETLARTAKQWSAMDPERAAALVQKLPESYDAAVFAQMSPDNVGPIMDALPPVFAAKIISGGTQPQISAQTGR